MGMIGDQMKNLQEKSGLKWMILYVFVLVASIFLILANAYIVWDAATTKASAQFKCDINQIDYVTLKGNGSCWFPVVQGDKSMCALPRDIHCEGLVQDFPIVKGLLKLRG